MFGGKKKKPIKGPKVSTVLGAESEICGDLTFRGGLHVDGTVRGNVIAAEGADAMLILSNEGHVEGEVRVPRVVLNGEVVGDVYATEYLELAPQARVSGNVYYKLLEMAMGAEVNGSLVHQTEEEPAALLSYEQQSKKTESPAKKPETPMVETAEVSANT